MTVVSFNEAALDRAYQRLQGLHHDRQAVPNSEFEATNSRFWAAAEEIAGASADTAGAWAIKAKAARLLIEPGGLTQEFLSVPLADLFEQILDHLGG